MHNTSEQPPARWGDAHGVFHKTYAPNPHDKLLPGKYRSVSIQFLGPGLAPLNNKSDQPIIAQDSTAEQIFNGIIKFMEAKPRYKKFGRLHKRGILLNSRPGFGKTMTCIAVANRIVEAGGVAVFSTAGELNIWDLVANFENVREVHPDMPILNVIEDIDKSGYGHMEAILDMLDGFMQVDGIIHLATTNYIGQLDERLTKRPSRFDEVITLGPPSEVTRRDFIKQLIPADEHAKSPIEALIKASDGLAYAQIKELVLGSLLLGKDMDALAKHLLENMPTEIEPLKPKRRK